MLAHAPLELQVDAVVERAIVSIVVEESIETTRTHAGLLEGIIHQAGTRTIYAARVVWIATGEGRVTDAANQRVLVKHPFFMRTQDVNVCLLYPSDAADE